jgi:Protein of unknown function (DUF5672)
MLTTKLPGSIKSDRPERLVAVVTPIPSFPLSAEAEISMRHLLEYLGRFDRYIIGPKSLPKEFSDFVLQPFPNRHFTSRYRYNRLLMTEEFYRAFSDYEYILIYQLDCLVFASSLEEWCRKDWDYVGAPWLNSPDDPAQGFLGVGNGGLSLRRVKSALAVLTSKQLLEDPRERGRKAGRRSKPLFEHLDFAPKVKRTIVAAKTILHRYGYHNNVAWHVRQLAKTKSNEDLFWGFDASKVMANFCVPVPEEALKFSFEVAPRYCFKLNSGRLPFGCHAWSKYDREFWEPFLLK